MTPPPIPNASNVKPTSQFPHQAAIIGLVAPLMALLAGMVIRTAAAESIAGQLISGGLAVLLFVVGLCAAIVALCGIPRYGARGLLGRGVAGVLINGLFVLLMAVAFVTSFFRQHGKTRQARQELASASKDLRHELQNSFDEERGITNFNLDHLSRMQAQLTTASSNLSGDEAIGAKAGAAYLARVQGAILELQSVVQEVTTNNVLDFRSVSAPEQLQPRREMVQRMITANQQVLVVINNAEAIYRAELKSLKPSVAGEEMLVAGFMRGVNQQRNLILRIRRADLQIGASMLAIFDLLEGNWTKWAFDADLNNLRFSSEELVTAYNGHLDEINRAAKDQIQAQKLLVNLN